MNTGSCSNAKNRTQQKKAPPGIEPGISGLQDQRFTSKL